MNPSNLNSAIHFSLTDTCQRRCVIRRPPFRLAPAFFAPGSNYNPRSPDSYKFLGDGRRFRLSSSDEHGHQLLSPFAEPTVSQFICLVPTQW